MTKRAFLAAVQSRAARAAVGVSTVRGSPTGTLAAARRHLCRIDLGNFSVSPSKFQAVLDAETKKLAHALPNGSRSWGLARKVLNIFLRDCLYTTYLEQAYKLRKAESAFEIPLDSVTAKGLKRLAGRGRLPRWPGVKHITPAANKEFQSAALTFASNRDIHRVHLDSVLWSQSRDEVARRTR